MYSAQENVAVHGGLIMRKIMNFLFIITSNLLKQNLSPFTSHKNCVIWGVYPISFVFSLSCALFQVLDLCWGQLSSSCCVLFLSYSVGEEEVNCLGDPKGTVLTDRLHLYSSQKLNDT